jgi:type II secretion system protein G
MEKKENAWRLYSLRAILGFRNFFSNFLGKFSSSKSSQGFTLIELLITIGIVGILAAGLISIVNPMAQYQRANDAKRKSDLSQIQKALESYYQDVGTYPAIAAQCAYTISGDNGDGNNCIEWGSSWMPYMGTLPKDPASPSKKYIYFTTVDRQTYYIYASLDRDSADSQACNRSGQPCAGLAPNGIPQNACASGSIVCNYGVSSPNVSP